VKEFPELGIPQIKKIAVVVSLDVEHSVFRFVIIPERSECSIGADKIFSEEPELLAFQGGIRAAPANPVVISERSGIVIPQRNIFGSAESEEIICFEEFLVKEYEFTEQVTVTVIQRIRFEGILIRLHGKILREPSQFYRQVRFIAVVSGPLELIPEIKAAPDIYNIVLVIPVNRIRIIENIDGPVLR
jgi:hypothetical protein